MRPARYEKEIENLLAEKEFLGIEDFVSVCPGMPMPTIYSKVRKLQSEGRLSILGKGKYLSSPKLSCPVTITPWMREVNDFLIANCPGIDFCISEKAGNLFVQVSKSEQKGVLSELQCRYGRVILREDYDYFQGDFEGYIVLGRLISESPILDCDGIKISSFEKQVVDDISDGNQAIRQFDFQKTVEAHTINFDRLVRYATRRGVKEEVSKMVSDLDYERISLMTKVQKYLSMIPVERAWVFGSFARGEETAESDLDILVDYQNGSGLSLLDVVRFKSELEKRTGREVDLIQNGYLKPFAVPSVERDKYMIYER